MSRTGDVSRRGFLQGAVALMATQPLFSQTVEKPTDSLHGRMYKTLKIGMVKVPGSLADKFRVAKTAGFDGIELNSPGLNVEEAKRAIAKSGLPVDGTVCSTHWSVRHTDPNREVRAKALQHLMTAIRQTHAIGGHTVLLVVGSGKDGPEDDIRARSLENIAKALPLAARLGIYIAIENVWNEFLYDHHGGANQTAAKFVQYVDDLNSPWVGMQFDIGNHWKYGQPGDWIRSLGKRIVKLDVKGFSRKTDSFTKIGGGDIDWADVRKALREIGFYGWCAAEVGGGGPERLREIATNMNRVFALTPDPG
jgi:hexulose-6-phosphate isomerase